MRAQSSMELTAVCASPPKSSTPYGEFARKSPQATINLLPPYQHNHLQHQYNNNNIHFSLISATDNNVAAGNTICNYVQNGNLCMLKSESNNSTSSLASNHSLGTLGSGNGDGISSSTCNSSNFTSALSSTVSEPSHVTPHSSNDCALDVASRESCPQQPQSTSNCSLYPTVSTSAVQIINRQATIGHSATFSTGPMVASPMTLQTSAGARLGGAAVSMAGGSVPIILNSAVTATPVARFALVTRPFTTNFIQLQPQQPSCHPSPGYFLATTAPRGSATAVNGTSSHCGNAATLPLMLSALPPGTYFTTPTSLNNNTSTCPTTPFMSFTAGQPVLTATSATVLSLIPAPPTTDNPAVASTPHFPATFITNGGMATTHLGRVVLPESTTPSSVTSTSTTKLDDPHESTNNKRRRSQDSEIKDVKSKRVRKNNSKKILSVASPPVPPPPPPAPAFASIGAEIMLSLRQMFEPTFSGRPELPPSTFAGCSMEHCYSTTSPQCNSDELLCLDTLATMTRKYQQDEYKKTDESESKHSVDKPTNDESDVKPDMTVFATSPSADTDAALNWDLLYLWQQEHAGEETIASPEYSSVHLRHPQFPTAASSSLPLCRCCEQGIVRSQQSAVEVPTPLITPHGVEVYFSRHNAPGTSQASKANTTTTTTTTTNTTGEESTETMTCKPPTHAPPNERLLFCTEHCYQKFLRRLEMAQVRLLLHEMYLGGKSNNSKKLTSDLPSILKDTVMECYFCQPNSSLLLIHQGSVPAKLLAIEESEWNPFWKRKLNSRLVPSPLPQYVTLASASSKKRKNGVSSLYLWASHRWKRFKAANTNSSTSSPPNEKVKRNIVSLEKCSLPHLHMSEEEGNDPRVCFLCSLIGDQAENGPGRLLCYDVDQWLHVNCALWCLNVYETQGGALATVDIHSQQAKKKRCTLCGELGAGLPCYSSYCNNMYHVPCAIKCDCTFTIERGMYCGKHGAAGAGGAGPGDGDECPQYNRLHNIGALRRVYIDRPEREQIARVITQPEMHGGNACARVGSLVLHSPGQFLSHQLVSGSGFHTPNYLFPVGYCAMRYYWSMFTANVRAIYECSIAERNGVPCFQVRIVHDASVDLRESRTRFEGATCADAWRDILEGIATLRREAHLFRMFPHVLSAEKLFGLTEPHVVRILESLPGVLESLRDHEFQFSRAELIPEMPVPVNPSGCARAEAKRERYVSVVVQQQQTTPPRSSGILTTTVCPSTASLSVLSPSTSSMAEESYHKHLLASRHRQFRRLQKEYRENVHIKRSSIQGLGLYAVRPLEKHAMIIEYLGQLIRNEVANKREKEYEKQHRGVYMFRLSDECIVDATLCGGAARYINHSCNPNCSADILAIDNEQHIILIANRDIAAGEELTYDYNLEIEDDSAVAMPCLCGATNCRKWLNG